MIMWKNLTRKGVFVHFEMFILNPRNPAANRDEVVKHNVKL